MLQYLNDQYGLVENGQTPRGTSVSSRNLSKRDDEPEDYWNVWWYEAMKHFNTFNGIIDDIKNGISSVSDQTVV